MSVILVNASAGQVPLGDGVVHCSVSSPPYYPAIRQYEGDQGRDWLEVSYSPMPGLPPLTIPVMHCALGHEETPEAFIGHLVACYREVKRVLRDDGVCWLVIGDSYANDTKWGGKSGGKNYTSAAGKYQGQRKKRDTGLKQGDLMLIPHRLALALQADGWTVRNDCVWHKVAPMPESVQGTRWQRCQVKAAGKWQDAKYFNQDDGHSGHISNRPGPQYTDCPGCPRCEFTGGYVLRRGSWRYTRAHETVLHLTKGMGYWSDQEAVREAVKPESLQRYEYGLNSIYADKDNTGGNQSHNMCNTERMGDFMNASGRNPRSVLTPKPESYSGKHYAVFSTSLIRPLIKSSCPVRCCPACGTGWAAVVEREGELPERLSNLPDYERPSEIELGKIIHNSPLRDARNMNTVLGYRPTCDCDAAHDFDEETGVCRRCRVADFAAEFSPICRVPGIVLDPFFGSGTTGIVARELGVDCIGLDLSYDYLHDQARARLELDAWDAWHQGRDGDVVGDLEGLPLFEGVG